MMSDKQTHIIQGDARCLNVAEFITAPFGVLVVDPPWEYQVRHLQGVAGDQYETMTEAELRAVPVPALCKPDSILLLWGTWPKLYEAMNLLLAWQFEYVTGFPWIKMTSRERPSYGVGFWVRGCSEYVLIGRRGKVQAPRLEGFLGLLSPTLGHSHKPDSIHQIAEALPGPYLEMFGRISRTGWTVFGNDVHEVLL